MQLLNKTQLKQRKLEQKYANMDLVTIAQIYGTPEQARAAAEGHN